MIYLRKTSISQLIKKYYLVDKIFKASTKFPTLSYAPDTFLSSFPQNCPNKSFLLPFRIFWIRHFLTIANFTFHNCDFWNYFYYYWIIDLHELSLLLLNYGFQLRNIHHMMHWVILELTQVNELYKFHFECRSISYHYWLLTA